MQSGSKRQKIADTPDLTISNASSNVSNPSFFKTKTRSSLMHANIRRKLIPDYVEGQLFRGGEILTHNTTNFDQELYSIGGEIYEGREIIFLKPDSPLLQKLYLSAVSTINQNNDFKFLDMPKKLEILMKFVRENLIFTAKAGVSNDELTAQLLAEWMASNQDNPLAYSVTIDGKKIPVIPLDYFIDKKTCYCRHRAFFVACLLYKLIKEMHLPHGELHHHRDVVHKVPHAWVIYKVLEGPSANKVFSIDASLGKIGDLEAHQSALGAFYGKEVIDRLVQRYTVPVLPPPKP